MKRTSLTLLGAAALVTASATTSAAVIIDENFDSYADTTAMTAVWAGGGATLTADGTGFGDVGKAAAHPGGTVNEVLVTALKPTATENIHLSAKMLDDGAGNKRMTLGFRGGPFPLFEMGAYNQADANPYGARVTLFPGSNVSWEFFDEPGNPGTQATLAATAGWHTFDAVISLDKITVTVDLTSDGNIDGVFETALDGSGWDAADGLTSLRFGGPSNASSGGGGLTYDDILLETVAVPEPASIALLGLGGLFLARRRK
ncbi:PEP-CTERM sorting domain-containing protein [Poriferisphaera sp. WC338]|uniref:PEP-CTERM sorting domain-containing protein n=1 Tax=Poriferisphaera sp. WC338 TaxID=3425129 RepID=UPI003D81B620